MTLSVVICWQINHQYSLKNLKMTYEKIQISDAVAGSRISKKFINFRLFICALSGKKVKNIVYKKNIKNHFQYYFT